LTLSLHSRKCTERSKTHFRYKYYWLL